MTGGVPLADVRRYVENHPDADPMTVLAQLGLPPAHLETVEDVIAGEDPNPADEGCPADESAENEDDNAKTEPDDDVAGSWSDVDFSVTEPDTYPAEHLEREQWMGRAGESGKQPFAPWVDRDHPDADPDEDARWKWRIEDNYVNSETVAIAEDDPRLDGRAFIQLDDDPYGFVDGDGVRCPETDDVHPAFVAILEHLGLTYADVSDSEAGAHAWYRGDLPIEGKGQAAFDIDTGPWGANDSPPTVEIYANKHVNVATGDHVLGTPLEASEWDHDALRAILRANGYQDQNDPEISHDTDHDRADLEEYDPEATGAGETATDIRDVLAAVDRLGPRDLPLRSRQTGEDSTGGKRGIRVTARARAARAFTARRVNRCVGRFSRRTGITFGAFWIYIL